MLAATHASSSEEELQLDKLGHDIASIKLLDSLSGDPKPSFLVQSSPRPPCSSHPVSWFNAAARTRLQLGRSPSNAYSPTANQVNGDATPLESNPVDITDLARYDGDFNSWIVDRLSHHGENRRGYDIPYYTCCKGILWTTTRLQAGDIEYLQFTGIPLSWKIPTEAEQRKAERSMSDISAQTLNNDDFRSSTSRSPPKDHGKDHRTDLSGLSLAKRGSWAASLPESPAKAPDKSELEKQLAGATRRITRSFSYNADEQSHRTACSHPDSDRKSLRRGKCGEGPVTMDMDERIVSASDAIKLPPEFLEQTHGVIDWTRCESSDLLPDHHKVIRDYDWASTSLGPIEDWPLPLRTTVVTMCASCFPSALYYGPDLVLIYNDPFKDMMSSLHPWGLGKPCREVWGGVFEDLLSHRFANVMRGVPTYQEDHEVNLTRNGFTEQRFMSWTLSPIVDETGKAAGVFSISADLTARVLASRSFQMFGEIGTRTSGITNTKAFWENWLSALQTNETDAPFAIVYSRIGNDGNHSSRSGGSAKKSAHDFSIEYEGSYNVPEGHICMPPQINLAESDEGFAAAFREACDHEHLYLKDSELAPPHLLEGLKSTVFGDPITAVAICPIYSHSAADEISGFLVLGLNTRRPWEDDYILFVQLLSRQLSTCLSANFFFEAEVRRSENLARIAAMEKIILSNQLAAKTMEAKATEFRFKRFLEAAPIGIYVCDHHGRVTFVNDAWYELTQVPRGFDPDTWTQYVHPDDVEMLMAGIYEMNKSPEPLTQKFRWKAPYTTKDGQVTERWCLGMTQPEYAEDGTLLGYLGCSPNISEQVLREKTQKRRLEEARELKRQQDNFVDIASHEMRNPLSAILQLSDTIICSLSSCEKYFSQCDPQLEEEVSASIDAAQTILLCASHQKRVVDDILTLSKLDSARLMITPVDVQPVAVVNEAIKMFEQECKLNDIHMDLEVDDEYRNLAVDWVKLDPTRLLQVLINLLTNALKFIRSEAERNIIITLSASLDKPVDPEGLMVFPSIRKSSEASQADAPESNEEQEDSLFLSFEVKDTGKGLTDEEKKMLFQKFSQASPRTHIQYGGSGLGLFISRELVQLQCGEIGVLSEAGKGCAFCFYIKVARGEPQGTELPVYARTIVPGALTKRTPGNLSPPLVPGSLSRPVSPSVASGAITPGSTRTPEPKSLVGVNVLIVEDNLVNQKVVRKQLMKLGCETYVANHGLEALEKVMQSKLYMKATDDAYDLTVILMDVEMPVMDGLKATGEIRRLQAEGSLVRHIPIIAVTANARPEQIRQMKEAGMDDVLSKPFRIPELVSKLEGLVDRF
ncbi:hypothetical protein ABW19_dt0205912 [Dactylella cylindrospora]|nr:hypothetical protein ABW19_dt0205912 [Dactylella cylindrospora]